MHSLPDNQYEISLPARSADEIIRERLTEELRSWVSAFNANEHGHPSCRVHAIREIRKLRDRIRGLK